VLRLFRCSPSLPLSVPPRGAWRSRGFPVGLVGFSVSCAWSPLRRLCWHTRLGNADARVVPRLARAYNRVISIVLGLGVGAWFLIKGITQIDG
jgi:hypothetical protein